MNRPAIHPGEILIDELDELTITPSELARQINVPPNRITRIIHGQRAIRAFPGKVRSGFPSENAEKQRARAFR